MAWRNTYDDLSTKEKRQVRQQILIDCQIKKSCFYTYLDGKEGRAIIMNRISVIIQEFKQKAPVSHHINAFHCV
ncbi:MAG: hypothetical protein Q7W13_14100 [Bacteroidia bacterium]|nr:hypothetical protein [Bacteroidia bacterium]